MIMLRSAELFLVRLRFKQPMRTALSAMTERETTILRLTDTEGYVGYGEGAAFSTPWYTSETQDSIRSVSPLLHALLMSAPIARPADVTERLAPVRGNQMAKAMFDGAIHELFASRNDVTLAESLGGDPDRVIACGKAIGRMSIERTTEAVAAALADGFTRIKLKLGKEDALPVLESVRASFPDAPLMFDANGSFRESDIPFLLSLDPYRLQMIEQPFDRDDWMLSAQLSSRIETPICLDESVETLGDALLMTRLCAGSILNIKPARVGGLSNALAMRKLAPAWLGGMFDSGIGRRQTLALATLSSDYPIDFAGTDAYFELDLLEAPYTLSGGSIRYFSPAVSEEALRFLTYEYCML